MTGYIEFKHEGQKLLDVAEIEVPKRLRPVDLDYVEALKVSISDKGQMQPIEVVKNLRRESKTKDYKPYILISGAHRLAACKALDSEVLCSVVSYQGLRLHEFEIACRLREIDENLVRHELNPLDRAVFLYERKRIYEDFYPETKNGAQGGPGGQKNENDTVSFSKDTAEKLGLSERTIDRACMIAKNIPDELKDRIRGTWLSQKQGELVLLARQGPALQESMLDALFADGDTERPGKIKSVGAAMKIACGTHVPETVDTLLKHLKSAYRNAPATTQKQFLYHLRDTGEFTRIEEYDNE